MALIIEVSVRPSSGKQQWIIDAQGRLKCYLKSAPEKGRANKELIKLLAKTLGYGQTDIEIVSGATSRSKRLKIHRPLTYDQLVERLGLARQVSLF